MDTIPKVLLDHLEELVKADLKSFKWHLTDGVLHGIAHIPRGKLENCDAQDTVDKMKQYYGAEDAGKIAVRVLREMKENNLAGKLQSKLTEMGVKFEDDAGAPSSTPPQAASTQGPQGSTQGPQGSTQGPQVSIRAETGGSVRAPVIHGGVFHGDVTFN
ncbi:NACHT, LRR and PYD domains-containing protein 6 [Chanos chanos]|uniref:NACHT, LRR and PYD domains-containing protein 6 n=1 Tax=Chanos chanos TaxID=29144 RepID=A0A6J2VY74_CHACN|nr:NACHT, LRR and PYD domains-containing protein 6-like [Chanos chanos]